MRQDRTAPCPSQSHPGLPSTVFASFNAYGGESTAQKEIEIYRFNNHEGGQEHRWIRQLQYLRKHLG